MMFLAINNLFSQTTDEIFIQNGIRYKIINSTEVSVISNNYSGDIVIPSQVTYEDDVYNVTSIQGFYGWDGVIADDPDKAAFQSCNVTSVIIPNSVTSIGEGAFSYCTNLSSVTISNNVTVIPQGVFYGCILNEITIPSSVTRIEDAYIKIFKDGLYYNVLNNNEVSVCGTESSTKDLNIPNTVTAGNTFTVKSIATNAFVDCKDLLSVTIPDNMDVSKSGLTFTKNNITYKLLSNSEVAICGVESTITDVTIPDMITVGMSFSVESIEANAFKNCTSLASITIPSNVTSIGGNAFSGCSKLAKVTCLATTPPDASVNTFENYNGYLYIPCESKDDYDIDACWGSFKHIECIGSETVELNKDEVAVVPEKNDAVFSMPKNENANSYTLTISNNGVTFCTLKFNAQGQLANIDFSTTKSYELKSEVEGFQFTVTGLSTASDYGYSFKALASNKSVLKEYAGSFTTKNEDGTGGSSSGGGEGTLAVDAVSNATAVTIVNGQILVNGEAPAFVVTVSGQKIANQNLKSGVYFVNVEGETVGVSVR